MKKINKSFLLFLGIVLGGSLLIGCDDPVPPSSILPSTSEEKESSSSLPKEESTKEHVCYYRIEDRREPTCVLPGEIYYRCDECGSTKSEEIAPTGEHSFTEWSVTLEPTYESEGVESRYCHTCDLVEENVIPILEKVPNENEHTEEHTLSYVFEDMESHRAECLQCDFNEVVKHEMEKVSEEMDKCIYCHYATVNHQHQYELVYDEFTHYYSCIGCGDYYGLENHDFDEGIVLGKHECESMNTLSEV